MIRVLIADDHAVVREGLKKILSQNEGISVVAEACDGAEIMEKARAEGWDVAILDISLPGRSGLEVLHDLRKNDIKKPMLILSMHPEEQYGVRALKAGADGYLNKESASEELVAAIRKVAGGGKYISPALAEQLARDLSEDSLQLPHQHLSDRELEVFLLLASGKTLTEIAHELSLSVKTISTYHTRILEKMKMKNNAELIRYACEHHLVKC